MMEKPVFKPDFWQLLADAQPYGIELTAEDVESWFDLKWPSYSQRQYKSHKKSVTSWWGRVREDEILQAIERRITIEDRVQIRRMEARLGEDRTDETPVVDHFAKLTLVG